MPTREHRLVVEGELSDNIEALFEGMTIRDQAELQGVGVLQRGSGLGLALLEVTVAEAALRLDGPDE